MKIAYGNSRFDKKWKNSDISWEDFTAKVSVTMRTTETVEEYRKMKRGEQDAVKDVGGFVGGHLRQGRRRKGHVLSRSMLTLDMDFGTPTVWEEIKMFFNYRCCAYSTHKHMPEAPRLRLIVPLKREVTAEEYEAVARKVAEVLDINLFDDSTYEPERLMFWPSTSKDGEFFFDAIEDELLDPNEYLAKYEDWHDVSTYPVSKRQSEVVRRAVSMQQDPLTKDGIVGAFCRVYPIRDAISKFLPEVYKPSAIAGRYDYVKGESSAGVVIYDEKYAYSFHATDPVSGRLLNAFDLVMLHKFGDDSFKEMADFAAADQLVKEQVARERLAAANEEFTEEEEWQTGLEVDKKGNVKDTLENVVMIIRNDRNLQGIALNSHRCSIVVKGELPWTQSKTGWGDSDLAALKVYISARYGLYSPAKTKDALAAVATERAFNPVREYLEQLPTWDEVPRVDTLLIDYLGAEDTAYCRAVTRKTLVAAVARVFEPGVKFDSVLILNGPQGIGKSTLFSRLGRSWFSDSLTISDMKDKTGAEKLQGYWILELGELAGMRKMDVEVVKSFISRVDDKYRASYGYNVESHPRQCVVVGSTNAEDGFLRDFTGNRRFWPIKVRGCEDKKPWDLTDGLVAQIWAEALSMYRQGEKLFLEGDEADEAVLEQAGAMEQDEREGIVRNYLSKLLPANWDDMDLYARRNFLDGDLTAEQGVNPRQTVSNMEIYAEAFGKDPTTMRKSDSYEIASIMSRIREWNKQGFSSTKLYGRQRIYVRLVQSQAENGN